MPGKPQDGRGHAAPVFGFLPAMGYMLAAGPPMSEMMPVKPGVLSRMVSISRTTEASERFWMMRPSCSGIEQKVQPPKQPRMIGTGNLSRSQAGTFASAQAGLAAGA